MHPCIQSYVCLLLCMMICMLVFYVFIIVLLLPLWSSLCCFLYEICSIRKCDMTWKSRYSVRTLNMWRQTADSSRGVYSLWIAATWRLLFEKLHISYIMILWAPTDEPQTFGSANTDTQTQRYKSASIQHYTSQSHATHHTSHKSHSKVSLC